MQRPRIAVPVPTTKDLEYNRHSWPNYSEALRLAGADAVEFSLAASPADSRRLSASCHGFLLPGSPADVDPIRYGQDPSPACAAADPAREDLDILLIDQAYATGKPLLAICFGCQMLNVWRGGTLVQDLSIVPVNHSAGGAVAIAHTAVVVPDSMLATLLTEHEAPLARLSATGSAHRLPINSSHHQALAIPGNGLCVVARCPQDGVIEAIEGADNRFLLGVQWHPERSVVSSPASRSIFDRFVMAAAHYSDGKPGRADPLQAMLPMDRG